VAGRQRIRRGLLAIVAPAGMVALALANDRTLPAVDDTVAPIRVESPMVTRWSLDVLRALREVP
jgi:hypothetical protein